MSQGDFASNKLFYDTKNFPRGFNRSGVFSRTEAELLERHGYAMKELAEGNRQAVTDVERAFLEVVRQNKLPETVNEKAWVKYQKHMGGRKAAYTTGMAIAMSEGSESVESVDSDM